MKPHPVPKVGDTVVLNDFGLRQIFNNTLGLAHMKTLRMKVTQVDSHSMTYPKPTFCLEVDNEEINAYLIDHHCFDIVESAHSRQASRSASSVRYEAWGTTTGRSGIQRTLDANDQADIDFLTDGICMVDEHGNQRPLTLKEAELMGVRRVVAARDIFTGELRWDE